MSQTRDQQCLKISEVAADWHEPMVPQCIMHFSVATPPTWNSLPPEIRLCENILTFKCHLKTHLFKLTESSCAASSAPVSSDLKALYKSVIIIIIMQQSIA